MGGRIISLQIFAMAKNQVGAAEHSDPRVERTERGKVGRASTSISVTERKTKYSNIDISRNTTGRVGFRPSLARSCGFGLPLAKQLVANIRPEFLGDIVQRRGFHLGTPIA